MLTDPQQAHYQLQVAVLYVGKASATATQQALGAGFGGPLAGAIGGTTAGAALGHRGRAIGLGAGVGGLVGGAAELVSGALVKHVTYTAVVDVQVSERAAGVVQKHQTATLSQGSQTQRQQTSTSMRGWQHDRTRVVATATRVNLQPEVARPARAQGLVRSLAGLL